MMKHLILVALGLAILLAPLGAEKPSEADVTLGKAIRGSIEALSRGYAETREELTVKRGVAVVEFEAEGLEAKDRGFASTVTSYVEEEISRSLIFFLVDRKNIARLLSEMELSVSGLFDESTVPRLGELRSAQALIVGRVDTSGDTFRVSMKLVDVETGIVSAATSFSVSRGDMSAAATELQYRYVAANGIGIVGSMGGMPFRSSTFNRAITAPWEFGMTYRPNRNWMVSASAVTRLLSTDSDVRFASDWNPCPEYTYGSFHPGGTFSGGTVDDINNIGNGQMETQSPMVVANFDYFMLGLSGQFTLNIFPWLNIGLHGGPLFHVYEPRMKVSYGSGSLGGLFYREKYWDPDADGGNGAYGYHPALDTGLPEYTFDSYGFAGARVEVRPEVFITPRLAIALRIGYLWTLPLSVGEVNTTYARWTFRRYQPGVDPATWTPDS